MEALVDRVAHQVDLANFQPSAIFQGFIDSVVWLRSDFPLGQYNGPPPGHYRRLLAMPDYSAPAPETDPVIGDGARPLLTCFPISGEPFCEYGRTLVHESRKEVIRIRQPGVPVERNTLWDGSWECARPPVENLAAAFDHSVVTLDQVLAPDGGVLEQVRQRLRVGGPDASDWILDIDLDYFATYSPLLAYLIRKHGWAAQADAQAFASWAVTLGQLCSHGLEEAARRTLFAPEYQPHTVREVVRMPFTSEGGHAWPSPADIESTFRSIHPDCQIPHEILRGLSDLVGGLTMQQRGQWASLHADDWWWMMQSQGPHHYSTPEEISASVQRLEQILAYMPYPPSLITIARSLDMYMPEGASDLAEWEVLLMLRRVWPHPGDLPLPARLRECDDEDVRRLLEGVTLFHTSRPLPGEEPGPLLPRPWPFDEPPRARRDAADVPIPGGVCACVATVVAWGGTFELVD